MSTDTAGIDCDNCGVSAATNLSERIVNRDEDGERIWIHCDLCGHLDPEGVPADYIQGEQIDLADVPARARALLIAEHGWREEDLDDIESFIAVDEYAVVEAPPPPDNPRRGGGSGGLRARILSGLANESRDERP